jgi:AcrR family transcriptional regulator
VTSPPPAATGRRGRPRDATIDHRVLAAAVEELGERGVEGFSVNSVAVRAGVAKRGIYSRWPRRDDLVLAAMGTLAANLVPPRTGSLRGDLEALAPRVAAVFSEPRLTILTRCLAEVAQYPELYAVFRRESIDRCMAAIQDAFHDAAARGEARADLGPGLAMESFLGAMLAHFTLGGAPGATGGPGGPGGLDRARAEEAAGRDERAFLRGLVEFCVAAAGITANTTAGATAGPAAATA